MLEINPFRKNHLSILLNEFASMDCPLDGYLAHYFRTNKAIGSKDRKILSEIVYGITRWQGLLDHLLKKPISWQGRIEAFISLQPERYLQDLSLPAHVRLSFPKAFYELLVESLGEKEAWDFCLASNYPAPTTLRVNTLKTSREALMKRWEKLYEVMPTKISPYGIQFGKRENFFAMEEFTQGLFEVQDEGSQLIADLVEAKSGDHVLDYCAGSGGKTLAFAHKLGGKGQIYLHDVRQKALVEAKKRLARAGIQNAQIVDPSKKNILKGRMDWVLVDVPCTGTGTLRRNPDRKWKFQYEELDRLVELQKAIVQEALQFVKPGGFLVYATCSVLPQENDAQIEGFLKEYGLKQLKEPFRSLPCLGEMDGFFGVILQKAL